jgi:hypothetical protein
MGINDLVSKVQRKPFEPFRVVMDDGVTYEVRHPDMVLITPTSAVIGYADPAQPRVSLRYDIVSMLHISRLEELEPTPAPGQGNGQS